MELYNDARSDQFDIKYSSEGPSILKTEVQNVIRLKKSARMISAF